MKIRTVEYVGTVGAPGQPAPSTLPQVAFSGRSNVGKSSLINTVLGRTRRGIAHVSAKPGKTRAINFYEVNGAFCLVDLPGFGYAKVPQATRDAWAHLIDDYLRRRGALAGLVHLVDARRGAGPLDHTLMDYAAELALPVLVVVTKMDKLRSRERAGALHRVAEDLGMDEDQVLPFSSKTGEGKDALLEALEGLLSGGAP